MGWSHVRASISPHDGDFVNAIFVSVVDTVAAGDLIIVSVAADRPTLGFLVGDDAPAGGNTYTALALNPTPGATAKAGLYAAIVTEPAPRFTVAVLDALFRFCTFRCVVDHWRADSAITNDAVFISVSTGDTPTITPVVTTAVSSLVVVWCVQDSEFVTSVDAPIALVYNRTGSDPFNAAYATGLVVPGTHGLVEHLSGVDGYAMQAATFSYAVVPPPSNPPSSSFSGGTQPAPVYYKQEGGPIISRPLRRRLRSEGFHV